MRRKDVVLLVCGKGRVLGLVRLLKAVGVAVAIAQIRLDIYIAVGAAVAVAAVGALQQCGRTIIERRLGAILKQIAAAQLGHAQSQIVVALVDS